MIFIVDFGSQTAHLILRRITERGAKTELVSPKDVYKKALKSKPSGLIFSGGPASVYETDAPTIDPAIFSLDIPILGICYGFQIISKLMGGEVVSGKKEYGPTKIKLKVKSQKSKVIEELPGEFIVWMSHGDEVTVLPKGFEVLASTKSLPFAFVQHDRKNIFGLQFHPEVEHTEYGLKILENFLKICQVGRNDFSINIENIKQNIQKAVGDAYVLGAVSGGVDSTVAAILTGAAIGKKLIPVYVENGLMREGTKDYIKKIFKKFNLSLVVVDVEKEMLKRLGKILDSEKKRRIIGNFYIEVFEKQMQSFLKQKKDVKFLLQGTIYSDVIESKGTKHASKIKSHHNVGGLPKKMKLKLLEPLRYFYKDQVRKIGKTLGLEDEFINKQPFPGPGYAIRIRGEVTKARLKAEKMADKIILEELEAARLLESVFISFPVMTNSFSTAVKGDARSFQEVVAVRIVDSSDVMTAAWSKIPYDVLQQISSRIVNEVPGVSRVVYDITTKPPATMEWE